MAKDAISPGAVGEDQDDAGAAGGLPRVLHIVELELPTPPEWFSGPMKQARNARGLSQKDLAAHVDMAQATLSNAEREHYDRSSYTLRLAAALEIDLPPLTRLIWNAIRLWEKQPHGKAQAEALLLSVAQTVEAIVGRFSADSD